MTAVQEVCYRELRYLILVAVITLILAVVAYFINQFTQRQLLEFQVDYNTQKSELDRLSMLSERISFEDSLLGNTFSVDSLVFVLEINQLLDSIVEKPFDDSILLGQKRSIWGKYSLEYRLSLTDSLAAVKNQLVDNLSRQNDLLTRGNTIFKAFISAVDIILLILFPARWLFFWLKRR
jgi:hypothetical protein